MKAHKTKMRLHYKNRIPDNMRVAYDIKDMHRRGKAYFYDHLVYQHCILSGCWFKPRFALSHVVISDLYGVQIKK